MIDPDFDPLLELEEQANLIQKLINSHNKHDVLLLDITQQHKTVVDLIREDREKIVHLENKVKIMSQMIEELYASK